MHIMNLNIQFEISSEQDVVKVSSVLVADGQTFEELNLGRIKEFYPESWEKATPAEDEAPKKEGVNPINGQFNSTRVSIKQQI